jgi:hypothetical protein
MEFQSNCSIPIENLKDLMLVIFVLTDDLYEECAPDNIKHRLHKEKAVLSDSEIITIALAGEIMTIDSERSWISFVRKNMRDLFPHMCERSRFNRLRRNLCTVMQLIRIKLGEKLEFTRDDLRIVDSFPLEVCEFGRAHFCKTFRYEGANYGYCASKKKTFFGYRVHALCTASGYITDILLAPASFDDRDAVWELVETYYAHLRLIGDKGYVGAEFAQWLWEERGVVMISLSRRNAKNPDSKPVRQAIFKVRRRIETVFSQLADQFNAESVLAKTLWGLVARLNTKILAYDICFAINWMLGREDSFAHIKALAF